MTVFVTAVLWTVLFVCVGLGLLGASVRRALYNRHDLLMQAWADMRQRNEMLCDRPGPIELEDFPGVRESWNDIDTFGRFWMVLTAFTCVVGMMLSFVISMGGR
ncbi:hypothetical protein [Streptomyces violaceusniger]|uniref:Uncharacterized protein n=1 Tax=Streptomyces violaceusniger (strain Tu 4113) TaxID=653045 RepID=G2PHZ3_STRV4|nr:hypothetical protein [Streptomyces violaceusniger]AEM88944.1 hypothetical protein Strvi_0171 [Streptomyces violaceusniger Tu 4113]